VSNKAVSDKTNKEEVFHLIQRHPEGQDDDDICRMTGIMPRQQVKPGIVFTDDFFFRHLF